MSKSKKITISALVVVVAILLLVGGAAAIDAVFENRSTALIVAFVYGGVIGGSAVLYVMFGIIYRED